MVEVLGEEAPTTGSWRLDPPRVAAVLVLHDGARWLPAVLDAITALSHRPDELVVVDVGSGDGGPDLVTRALPGHPVHNAPAGAGFGEAVEVGLRVAAPADWVWVLHDDCAPAPDALAHLLDEATAAEDVAIVGPKVREWPSLRRLVEVGVTITGTGHRETGLERGEPDQGQHDRPRDVLAVGSAGMLVRRSAWDRLDGFDPMLPRYGDDLDLGWRANRAGLRVRVAPRAVVFHVEAASRSLRADGLPGSPLREQRRAALFTLLANASRAGFAWQSVRLVLGSLVRVLALLVAKAPGEARDELLALGSVYAHPGRMFAARRRRAAAADVPASDVRRLLPSPVQPYQHGLDSLVDVVTAFVRPAPAGSGGRRASAPGRRVQEAGPEPELPRRRRAWIVAALVLVATLVAARDLLGAGSLVGGALAAAPDSAGAWWSGLVADVRAPGYLVALAVPATLVWGVPGLVVDVLVLGAVPLAALTAYRFARRVLVSHGAVAWWAATWALGVAACGAVAQGRLGTVVALVLAPVVAGAVLTVLEVPGWQAGIRLGAWLGLATAFAPVAWLLCVPALVVTVLATRNRQAWRPVVIAAVVPLLVAWPRSLAEAGLDGPAADPGVLDLLVGRGGGPGAAPWWLGVTVVLAGLVGLLRPARRTPVVAAWAVGLVGLALAAAGIGSATSDGGAWVGLPAATWAGALALAGAMAADGWRNRVVPVVVVVCLVGTAATVGWWLVRGGADPLRRDDPVALPAYLVDRATAGESTLALSGGRDGTVAYEVVRGDGHRLGDESLPADAEHDALGPADVQRFVTEPSAAMVRALAADGVGAIYLRPPADPGLLADLDSLAGLSPSGTPDPDARAFTVDDVSAAAAPVQPWWSRTLAWTHLVVVGLVVLLALPGRRRRQR